MKVVLRHYRSIGDNTMQDDIDELYAIMEELLGRVAELEKALESSRLTYDKASKSIVCKDIKEERDRLRAALEKYGGHTEECYSFREVDADGKRVCNCGWEQVGESGE